MTVGNVFLTFCRYLSNYVFNLKFFTTWPYSFKPQQPSADPVSHTLRWPPPDNPCTPQLSRAVGESTDRSGPGELAVTRSLLTLLSPPRPSWSGGWRWMRASVRQHVSVSSCVRLWRYICTSQTVWRKCGCKVQFLTEAAGLQEQHTGKEREAHPPETSYTQVRHTTQIHVNTPCCSC